MARPPHSTVLTLDAESVFRYRNSFAGSRGLNAPGWRNYLIWPLLLSVLKNLTISLEIVFDGGNTFVLRYVIIIIIRILAFYITSKDLNNT